MENDKQFSTRTDQRWYAGFTVLICLGLAVAGGIGMWLWTKMPGPALLVSGVFLFTAVFMGLMLLRQKNIALEFIGDELHIRHVDGNLYEVYAVPASDFVCHQSSLEKKYNVGRISIKKTIFNFYGVQRYDETCSYIKDNFPDF